MKIIIREVKIPIKPKVTLGSLPNGTPFIFKNNAGCFMPSDVKVVISQPDGGKGFVYLAHGAVYEMDEPDREVEVLNAEVVVNR